MKRIRLSIVSLWFTFLYLALVGNIYQLQIKNGGQYAAQVAAQRAGILAPKRGNIYFSDRNGNSISAGMTKEYPVIFAVPKDISDPESVAALLSPVLSLEEDKLIKYFSKPNDEYELLIRKATVGQVEKIRELKIKGIYIEEENYRYYPLAALASHVIGFIAPTADNIHPTGRYGLELHFDDLLSGAPGRIEGNRVIDPVSGQDIKLTIDANIQTRAEEILQNLIQKFNAEKGMVIVQEPNTGKILAMGSYPNFDPNNYSESAIQNYLNPAVLAVYEPGSVMKVVTMASGLDANKLTPDTTFFDSGSLILDGKTIKNWDLKAHGKITMTEVIEQSINTGAAYAEKLIGPDLFYNYLVKFGFGQKTGISLPGELGGSLENLKKSFREINFATAAFGQGVSVTPLQMLNAFSAIANGGNLMRPYILQSDEPLMIRKVISSEAAKQATGMMVSAVKKAQIAQIPKFDIAGKTGTAQIPDFKNGGYSDQYIHNYIGFAPAYNPKFTVFIRIDKPQGAPLAGLTVVPAFRELSEFVLNYYNIPPDHIDGKLGN